MLNVAFTGGGTGGHIYPGLAVASALKERRACRVFWIGSKAGMDRGIVEGAGIEFFGVPAGKLRRYVSPRNVGDIFRVIGGFFAARRILRREKPVLLFSKGGFVSVPPCAAAFSLGIPVFTHESDFSPGLATRINSKFVGVSTGSRRNNGGRIFTAYEKTAAFFPPEKRPFVTAVGNPVRPTFRASSAERGRRFLGLADGERVLLVLGGSQGAAELNDTVLAALDSLTKTYTVVHQTGPKHDLSARKTEKYRPCQYIKEEMPDVIACAELVLCRAGANTIWECAFLGRPMILSPLAGSGTRGDQVENAEYFREKGAALVLESGQDAAKLAELVAELAGDEARRQAMSRAAAATATDATDAIADVLAETPAFATAAAGERE